MTPSRTNGDAMAYPFGLLHVPFYVTLDKNAAQTPSSLVPAGTNGLFLTASPSLRQNTRQCSLAPLPPSQPLQAHPRYLEARLQEPHAGAPAGCPAWRDRPNERERQRQRQRYPCRRQRAATTRVAGGGRRRTVETGAVSSGGAEEARTIPESRSRRRARLQDPGGEPEGCLFCGSK